MDIREKLAWALSGRMEPATYEATIELAGSDAGAAVGVA
jgi:hypothetical protein